MNPIPICPSRQPVNWGFWCPIFKTMVLGDVRPHRWKYGMNGKLLAPTSWCNHVYNHKIHNLVILTNSFWITFLLSRPVQRYIPLQGRINKVPIASYRYFISMSDATLEIICPTVAISSNASPASHVVASIPCASSPDDKRYQPFSRYSKLQEKTHP